MEGEHVCRDFREFNFETMETTFRVEYEGTTHMPISHADIRVKAIMQLLDSLDPKFYVQDGQGGQADRDCERIIEATKAVFGHDE